MKKIFVLLMLLGLYVGISAAQTAHSVKLGWTTSTSGCVVNTNVHRSLTSGGQVIGTNFAVVPDPGHGVPSTFTDVTVVGGGVYYYTISAYGSSCGGTTHESAMSAEFKAIVPVDCAPPGTIINGVCVQPPLPPSGLTGTVQ